MHGNVWEWCLDWYGVYPAGESVDYRGPASGEERVIRGGAWNQIPGAAGLRAAEAKIPGNAGRMWAFASALVKNEAMLEVTSVAKETIQRALPIRQPFAELIFQTGRHRKGIEYRSRPTKIRERVYIYACSGGTLTEGIEESVERHYGVVFRRGQAKMKFINFDSLPRGLLIGTVDIVDCTDGDGDFEWHLANPKRLNPALKADKKPVSGGFFFPFKVER